MRGRKKRKQRNGFTWYVKKQGNTKTLNRGDIRERKQTAFERYKRARKGYTTRREEQVKCDRYIVGGSEECPKLFHRFKRRKLKIKEQIIRSKSSEGKFIDTDEDIREELNLLFQCVYRRSL